MTIGRKHLPILALGVAATIGAGFAAAGNGQASGPLSCEIVATPSGGMTAIEGVARSNAALTGNYRLRVSGPGTNISQGGPFDAAAGRPATLGSVMLGGSGGSYDVRLEVEAGGTTVSCSERIGSWL